MSQSAASELPIEQEENIQPSSDGGGLRGDTTSHVTKIAYLMKTYPRLSETFILNEIIGLEELGAQLKIFSLRRPDDVSFHPAVEKVRAEVTYSLVLTGIGSVADWLILLGLHIWLFLHRPAAYVQTLWSYLKQPGRQRMKEVLHAGYFAHRICESGCTHIHAHFANVPTTVAELIHGFTGLPYSFTAHAKDIYHSSPAELDRKISKADFVLTCTDYNRRYLTALSTSETKIYCVYHGINLSLFDGRTVSHERSDSGSRVPLILSVGRFCEKKGFPYLIRACRLLLERGLSFRCVIVGYGPMLEELDALIVELGVEATVSLSGKMTQDRVAEMYRSAEVFALPCLVTDNGDRDGIPNVLIEAMAQRLAVVSTDVSGISELIEHGSNGMLIPEKSSQALADALETLLLQPDLRRQMGDRGREKVTRSFSLESSASEVWAAFQSNCPRVVGLEGVTHHD